MFHFAIVLRLATLAWLTPACAAQAQDVAAPPDEPLTFTNPIVESGQDPWVILKDGQYYYCGAISGNRIAVSCTPALPLIGRAERSIVWTAPPDTAYAREIWAPELHHLRGRWYIYFAADDGRNATHRMYVLEGTTQSPLDPFEFRGQITDATNRWAIDGTVMQLPGDRLYFIWSGWEGDQNVQQNLYIAPMSDPLTISGERVIISEPEHEWERIGSPRVNEGPQVLRHEGVTHLIYSASGSWTDDYCLGRLTLTGDNPLNRASWTKHPEPVFAKTDEVFGPGHASFVTSHEDTQFWIVYHAAKRRGSGWNRNVRMQRFTWNADGSPHFGRPEAPGVKITW